MEINELKQILVETYDVYELMELVGISEMDILDAFTDRLVEQQDHIEGDLGGYADAAVRDDYHLDMDE